MLFGGSCAFGCFCEGGTPSAVLRQPSCKLTRGVETRSEEHTSELQSRLHLVCRLLLEKKKNQPSASYSRSAAGQFLPPYSSDLISQPTSPYLKSCPHITTQNPAAPILIHIRHSAHTT